MKNTERDDSSDCENVTFSIQSLLSYQLCVLVAIRTYIFCILSPLFHNSMNEDNPSLYQQLGLLQGQVESILTTQHSIMKQNSEIQVNVRTDIEKMSLSVSSRIRSIEDDAHSMRLQIARLRWNQGLASAGIAFFITIISQLFFFYLSKVF